MLEATVVLKNNNKITKKKKKRRRGRRKVDLIFVLATSIELDINNGQKVIRHSSITPPSVPGFWLFFTDFSGAPSSTNYTSYVYSNTTWALSKVLFSNCSNLTYPSPIRSEVLVANTNTSILINQTDQIDSTGQWIIPNGDITTSSPNVTLTIYVDQIRANSSEPYIKVLNGCADLEKGTLQILLMEPLNKNVSIQVIDTNCTQQNGSSFFQSIETKRLYQNFSSKCFVAPVANPEKRQDGFWVLLQVNDRNTCTKKSNHLALIAGVSIGALVIFVIVLILLAYIFWIDIRRCMKCWGKEDSKFKVSL